jgi:methanogenic corrinoid protein MtbC1
MSEQDQMAARLVLHSARALSGYAASDLLESRPELKKDSGPDAFHAWQNLLARCLEELAAAVAFQRRQWFVEHVQWLQSLLAARGFDASVLKTALDCLGRVLGSELPEESAPAAVHVCEEGSRSLPPEADSSTRPLATDSVYGRLAGKYLLALLEGDRVRAAHLILDAAEAGHPVRDLYLQVLLPAQEEGGRLWQTAEINVAEEHFATATTRAVMAQLRGRAPAAPAKGKTLVTAAVAGNQHDIGLQAVADFFEMDGWRVIQLGCDVPIQDLVQAVGFYKADLLGLSVCLHSQLWTLKQTIQAVRSGERSSVVKILVGGRGLAGAGELAAEFGADACAADPVQAVALGSTLAGLGGGQ